MNLHRRGDGAGGESSSLRLRDAKDRRDYLRTRLELTLNGFVDLASPEDEPLACVGTHAGVLGRRCRRANLKNVLIC